MKTKIIFLSIKKPEPEKIKAAAEILKSGELVAFPTETVYGIGAVLKPDAVKKIFLAKGRPNDNPLIVHISNKKQLAELADEVPEIAEKLAEKFWPGPLTIVLKNKSAPKEVTAGLESVALRMPKNKIALALINAAGPLAAPSANISGKPSPTKAEHVFDDFNNKIPLILDGGETDIGLESTVVSLVREPVLLRPGKITKEQIEEVIGPVRVLHKSKKPLSPGMSYKHYSPDAKIILFSRDELEKLKEKYADKKTEVIFHENVEDSAKNLFSKFREADKKGAEIIFAEKVEEKGFGMALMNRLKKAAGI
jgi:L-threonylcarbamoyladenylate synthase